MRKYQDSGWAYKALAQTLIRNNASWNRDDLGILELRFPHIVLKLLDVWGTPYCRTYLDSLICDERGDRQGFPLDALEEIMVLSYVHDELHSQPADAWGHVRFKNLNQGR